MLTELLPFLVGVAILLFSTHFFVRLAKELSLSLKVSTLIVGTTIVAIGTSLPELSVSTFSAARGDTGLALGNIIGSNIVNVFLVLAVGILIGKLRIGSTKTQRNATLVILVSGIFLAMQILPVSRLIKGSILVSLAVAFTFAEYYWASQGNKKEDVKQFQKHSHRPLTPKVLVLLLLTFGLIFLGGVLTVSGVEKIAQLTHLSTTILGLSLTAIITSLPELLTTVFSEEEHLEKVAVGDILGSNIYNLLLIGGIVAFFPTSQAIPSKDWVFFLLATTILSGIIFTFKGRVIPKWVGVLLVFLFLGYLYFLKA